MSFTQIFDFTDDSYAVYDSDEIEFIDEKIQLKLYSQSEAYTEDFADDTDFAYDSDKAEFTGGLVQQKSQIASGTMSYATYTDSIDLNYGGGVLTGSPFGGASIVGNQLDLAHDDERYVDYDATLNADSALTGCIRFKITPNYSGAPVKAQSIFLISKAYNDVDNMFYLFHQTGTGGVYLWGYNSFGSFTLNKKFGDWTPTQGQTYEIEVNYDFNAGGDGTKVFIDGIEIGYTTVTFPRDNSIGLMRIGGNFAGAASNFYLEDLIIFDSVQHTTDYTPGYILSENEYSETFVILPEMEKTGEGSMNELVSLATIQSSDVKFQIQVGQSGNYLYWSGSAWAVAADTYAQSTDLATFNSNCSSLPVSGENFMQIKAVFPNADTQSNISNLIANMLVQKYLDTNPYVQYTFPIYTDGLEGFIEVATKTGSDEIKYILSLDSVLTYWDGAALSTSDGTYSQSNTAAEIETNKATLLASAKTLKLGRILLHSDNTETTPALDVLTITYNFAGEVVGDISTCIVFGYSRNSAGVITTDPVYFKMMPPTQKYDDNIVLRSGRITATPDSNGYFEQELIVGQEYKFYMDDEEYEILVPNLTNSAINDLI